jgi:hypothetical protein
MKSLLSFALGLIVGAGLFFGYEHEPQIRDLFQSPEAKMQARVSGTWEGTVDVAGYSVPVSLAVHRKGANLSGVITSAQVGDVPCDKLAVDPQGNISFSAHVQDKDMTFTGKMASDRAMAGTLTGSIGDGTWSLAKNKS